MPKTRFALRPRASSPRGSSPRQAGEARFATADSRGVRFRTPEPEDCERAPQGAGVFRCCSSQPLQVYGASPPARLSAWVFAKLACTPEVLACGSLRFGRRFPLLAFRPLCFGEARPCSSFGPRVQRVSIRPRGSSSSRPQSPVGRGSHFRFASPRVGPKRASRRQRVRT